MRHKILDIRIHVLLMALLLTACSQDEQTAGEKEMLRIAQVTTDVAITQEPMTRAYQDFPNGTSLGISTQDYDGRTRFYNDRNVPYTYDTSNSYYRWTSTQGIPLIDYDAAVSAYYPYTEGVDPAAIPVTTAVDWMCAPWQTSMYPNASEPTAIRRGNMGNGSGTGIYLYLHRIASQIRLHLDLAGYGQKVSGNYAYVTHVGVKGTGIGTSAVLNSLTNTLTDVVTGELIEQDVNIEIEQKSHTDAVLTENLLFIPLRDTPNTQITFYVVVDGIEFSVTHTFTGVLESNKYYTFILRLQQNRVIVESVTIRDFVDDNKSQVILDK